jgi:hypothetical protein
MRSTAAIAVLLIGLAGTFGDAIGVVPHPPAPAPDVVVDAGLPNRPLNVARIGNPDLDVGNRTAVVWMLDGATDEDFPWVVEHLTAATKRGELPALVLVGVDNPERRFDLTPPSSDARDHEAIPHHGGAAKTFDDLRSHLLPRVDATIAACGPRILMGESLAGLFILDAYRKDPRLFDAYVAFDPSAWWDAGRIVPQLAAMAGPASSDGLVRLVTGKGEGNLESTQRVHDALRSRRADLVSLKVVDGEDHGSIYRASLTPVLADAIASSRRTRGCSGPAVRKADIGA